MLYRRDGRNRALGLYRIGLAGSGASLARRVGQADDLE
jgi:hypothetical protein